jgi:IstB-like ATP binding protein
MLNQPMMEKLLAMRLHGLVEGLKTQAQDQAVNELSFLERLSLLIDQQWNWRENQALARRLKAAKLRGPACVEGIDYRARARSGQDGGACFGERFHLGAQSREHLRDRTLRRGQELPCFRAGAESLSRWLLSTLSAGSRLVSRTGPGSSRRQLAPLPSTTGSHRCSGHR